MWLGDFRVKSNGNYLQNHTCTSKCRISASALICTHSLLSSSSSDAFSFLSNSSSPASTSGPHQRAVGGEWRANFWISHLRTLLLWNPTKTKPPGICIIASPKNSRSNPTSLLHYWRPVHKPMLQIAPCINCNFLHRDPGGSKQRPQPCGSFCHTRNSSWILRNLATPSLLVNRYSFLGGDTLRNYTIVFRLCSNCSCFHGDPGEPCETQNP